MSFANGSRPRLLLSRTEVAELGWPRSGVDAIVRELDVAVPRILAATRARVSVSLALVERLYVARRPVRAGSWAGIGLRGGSIALVWRRLERVREQACSRHSIRSRSSGRGSHGRILRSQRQKPKSKPKPFRGRGRCSPQHFGMTPSGIAVRLGEPRLQLGRPE